MNDEQLKKALDQDMPPVPDSFHSAMLSAFAKINEENQTSAESISAPPVPEHPQRRQAPQRRFSRRSLTVLLVAALLTASVALAAALNSDLLASFWGRNAPISEQFPSLIRQNLAEVWYGDIRVRVDAAAYDGVSLYVEYSIRNTACDQLLGDPVDRNGEAAEKRSLRRQDLEEYSTWDVGWWRDCFWINGKEMDMPNMSEGSTFGGDEPGEIVWRELYRLDQENIYLSGVTRVALPIGKDPHYPVEFWRARMTGDDYGPEPENCEGIVAFYLDADDLRGVSHVTSGPVSTFPDGTRVWLTQADFTPVKLYVTLSYEVLPEQLELYRQTSPEADEPWFGPMVLAESWAYALALVDENGQIVFPEMGYGDGEWGMGDTQIYYVFPYTEAYPSPLYVAPVENGVADMSRRVLIRE